MKFQRNKLALVISAAGAILAGASAVFAQGTQPDTGAGIEEVYVTGSRIARSQFAYSSPVSIYDATDLSESSATSIDEFLMKKPEFNGYALGNGTNNGNNGAKMIDLRGLGHKRTLILVNGRRQVGSFVGGSLDLGAVDLNTIPMAMVERVEVLKDGASTAYGSDAIAGVVNLILKNDFEGVEISADTSSGWEEMWGSPDVGDNEQDGTSESFAITMGTNSDKGGVTMGIEYQNQNELLQGNREWGEFATWPVFDPETGQFTTLNLGSSNSRRIGLTNSAALDQIQAANGGTRISRFITDPATGAARAYNSATDAFNYAPVNALITPNERWQLTALGDHELFANKTVTVAAHGEIMYTKRKSQQRLAPDASFDVTDYQGLPNNYVPASNPYNPFGDNANNPWGVSGEDITIRRRFVESGGRQFSQNTDTFRFVAGFNGTFDFAEDVNWDLSYTFADNDETYETRGYGRFDRWATMVDPALCGADPACAAAAGPDGTSDVFGDYGSITGTEMSYLTAGSLKDVYQTKMTNLALAFDGEIGELAGGPVGWAAGFETRSERARILPDEFSAGGLTTGGALDPLRGAYTVDEVFAEVLLPVIANAPFAKSVNIEASARYSDYNTSAGDTDNYRLGVDWAISDEYRLRTVFSTGFRAPNMVEYFTQATTFPTSENYCEFWGERNDINDIGKTNCGALGYPADYEQGFQYQPTYSQVSAADELGPEKSDTWTVGFVWTPEFVEGLQLSIDWYSIEIDDYISLPDYNFLVKSCLESEGFSSSACDAFDLGTGVVDINDPNYGGLTDNASTSLGNLGEVKTEGVDFAVNYSMPVSWGPADSLNLSLDGSYLDTYEKTFPTTGSYELAGTAGEAGFAVFPEWRYNTSVGLSAENWSVAWNMRWIDEVDDLYRPAALTNLGSADDVYYHDLVGNYTWNAFTVTLGVDNITDEEPPTFHSGFTMTTAPGFYDTVGRRVWAGVKMSL